MPLNRPPLPYGSAWFSFQTSASAFETASSEARHVSEVDEGPRTDRQEARQAAQKAELGGQGEGEVQKSRIATAP